MTDDRKPDRGQAPEPSAPGETSCPENVLRESEERYKRLFTDSPISLWEEDFSAVKRGLDDLKASGVADLGRYFEDHPGEVTRYAGMAVINEVNQATLDLYKVRSREDLVAGLGTFFTEKSWAVFRDELLAVAEGRTRFAREISSRTMDGEEKSGFLSWTVPPAFAATYAKVMVSIVDVTDLKRTQEALREERNLLSRVAETSPAGITVLDRNGCIVFANRKAEAVFGLSRDEITQRAYNAPKWRITTYDGKPFPNGDLPFIKVRETLRPVEDVRHAIELPDGRRILLRVNAAPLLDEAGAFDGMVASIEDVTARIEAEEKLRASEEKYRLITGSMNDGVFTLDDRGRFTYISPSWLTFGGYAEEDLLGRPFTEILPESSAAVALKNYQKALSGEDNVRLYEIEARFKNGQTCPIELNMSNFVDAKGRVVGRLGVCRDITERKKAEAALRAALREKEVLLREVHHRVKNNMQVISSLINLQAGYLKDPGAREMFRESQRRIRSMALIHEKLYQSADFSSVPFDEYARTILVHLSHSFQIDPKLVGMVTDLEAVRLDMNRAVPCGLILSELVSNALKHAFPGRRRGEITVRLRGGPAGPYELVVADNGVGLPEGFDLRAPGTLGMEIVTMLAGQIDGTIEASPAWRGGTTFTLRFGPAPAAAGGAAAK